MDKIIHLSITKKDAIIRMDVVQYATEPKIRFVLDDFTPGTTASLYIKKPDGTEIFNSCTVSGNDIIYAPTKQSFAALGLNRCQLVIPMANSTAITFVIYAYVAETIVNAQSVTSQSEFNALTNALETVDRYDSRITSNTTRITSVENDVAKGFLWREVLPKDADLNDVIVAGRYHIITTNTNPNTPEGVTWGALEVLRAGATGAVVIQRVTANNIIYVRQSVDAGATWSTWRRQNDTFRNKLVANTDLNSVKNPGLYHYGNTDNIKNTPPNAAWGLLEVIRNSDIGGIIFQQVLSNNNIYMRQSIDTGATWSSWIVISDTYKYRLSSGTNLNSITNAGVYHFSASDTITNAPTGVAWGLLEVLRNGISGAIIFQRITSNNIEYLRQSTDYGETWTPWMNNFRGKLAEGTNLNTIRTIGQYHFATSDNVVNTPTGVTWGILEVLRNGNNYGAIIFQRLTVNNTIYIRQSVDTGSTWTDWRNVQVGSSVTVIKPEGDATITSAGQALLRNQWRLVAQISTEGNVSPGVYLVKLSVVFARPTNWSNPPYTTGLRRIRLSPSPGTPEGFSFAGAYDSPSSYTSASTVNLDCYAITTNVQTNLYVWAFHDAGDDETNPNVTCRIIEAKYQLIKL